MNVEYLISLLEKHAIDLILVVVGVICIGLAILLRMNQKHSK